jgi:hypothetical protein
VKVSEYRNIAKIVDAVANNASITQLYKCVELGAESVRVCSEFGNVECWHEKVNLAAPSLVLASAWLGVIQTLPSETELELEEVDNTITWKCGDASGYWSTVAANGTIPTIDHEKFEWTPDKQFVKAMELGASACQASTVTTGLYGMFMEVKDGTLRMMSSNNVSFAMATVDRTNYDGPSVTLRPPVPSILGKLLSLSSKTTVDITEAGIFVLSPFFAAHLPLSTPLEHNLVKIIENFSENKLSVGIDAVAIKSFLGRVQALADKGIPIYVQFGLEKGKMTLTHTSTAASTEEFFLAGGLDPELSFKTIKLPLSLLRTSIEHIDSANLDYLEKNILVLKGNDPIFTHIVGGATQKRKGSRSKQL